MNVLSLWVGPGLIESYSMDHDVCIRTDESMFAMARLSTGKLVKYTK